MKSMTCITGITGITSVFQEISRLLATLEPPAIVTASTVRFCDLHAIKSHVGALDHALHACVSVLDRLEGMQKHYNSLLAQQCSEHHHTLETHARRFGVGLIARDTRQPVAAAANITVDIGAGIMVKTQLYASRALIPVMRYGAISVADRPLVVFRYGKNTFVSCTSINVVDHYSMRDENFRTIYCLNGTRCAYGNSCKYYHDPLVWPDSTHVQKFPRNTIMKNNSTFGDAEKFHDHSPSIESLQAFSRYLAIMMILVQYKISVCDVLNTPC